MPARDDQRVARGNGKAIPDHHTVSVGEQVAVRGQRAEGASGHIEYD